MFDRTVNFEHMLMFFVCFGSLGSLIYLSLNATALETAAFATESNRQTTFQVTGTVTNSNTSNPIENVDVHAFRPQQSASDSFFQTDMSGQYTLTLTPGESYTLVFNPPTGQSLASKAVGGITTAQTLDVALESGFTISGIVYEDQTFNDPVGDVEIFAFNLNTAEGFGLPPADGSGNYSISLAAGTWEITFTPPPGLGFGPAQLDDFVLTQDEGVSVGLTVGFTVLGRVTNAGAPIEDVEVFAQKTDLSSGFGFSATDANGYYTGTLPLGTYDIRFQPPPETGFASVIEEAVSGPADQTINILLPSGNTFAGILSEVCTDENVNPSANTFIYAAPLPDVPTGSLGGWGEFTGADGSYSLSLPSSTYTVTITPPTNSGMSPMTIFGVEVTDDVTYSASLDCLFMPLLIKN
ncbi:MAG: carboxypeptidase regulatory-like domain-containing protein [Chloroflexota bacterium]